MTGTQALTQQGASAWASAYVAGVLARADSGRPAFELKPDQGPVRTAPAPSGGVEHQRDWLDGVTFDRPTELVPTVMTSIVELITGSGDERTGRALTQVLLAGYQFAQAGLHHAARGQGVIATGSSVLGKVLPTAVVALGAGQVWKGWNELEDTSGGPLAILGSRTGRSGLLNVLAGALAFVPGVGTAIGGAMTRLIGAANEMDTFAFLDAPTRTIESQGYDVARRVHVFDETPLDPYDRTRRSDRQHPPLRATQP